MCVGEGWVWIGPSRYDKEHRMREEEDGRCLGG